MIMCDCGKREMTKEEVMLKEENMKLHEENAMQAEHIMHLQKQIEELSNRIIELPESPIECAALLINAAFEYNTNNIQRAFGAGEKAWAKQYSVSELRQIAEHLLVYCKHNEESDNE